MDLLWKIRFRDSWLYLLTLLEFQSESDHFMALRILTYVCLTYEELIRRRDPERLAEVADAIIDCDSDAELFARIGM